MNCVTKAKVNKYKYLDWCLFVVLLAGYTLLMFTLFYRQTIGTESYYHSDMKAYILEMQGLDSGYSFPYPVFFKLGALFHLFLNNPPLSIALAITVLNTLSPLAMKYYMGSILEKNCKICGHGVNGEWKSLLLNMIVTASVFAILFVSMVYPPSEISLPGIKFKYVGVFSPNPFHNATYNATRPFAILCFFLYAKILPEYEKKTNWKDNLLFAFFLFMTTMTKPSFTFVLVPTAGLIMLYRMIKTKFANFVPSVQLGICFIPTFVVLLYQFFGVFGTGTGEERGLGFGIATAWKLHCGNIPLAVGLALGFPILVLVFNYHQLATNKLYRFAWQLLAVSLGEVIFLYEKGFRLPDMNFSWGYMHGIFFGFVASVLLLLENTWKRQGKLWQLALQWLAFGAHLVCGAYYFYGIFAGRSYY